MKNCLVLLCLSLLPLIGFSQKKKVAKETFGIKYEPLKIDKSCIKRLNALSAMPSDVDYGVFRYENMVLFCMSDKDWFSQIFDSRDDGIAVDIISRKQFECRRPNDYEQNNFVKGTMLKPMFLKDMKKNSIAIPNFEVVVPIAELPAELAKEEDLEFNLMVIKNDMLCHYMRFYDLPGSKLQLLQMDLFMDTLSNSKGAEHITTSKKLEFIIPFEKNKYEYKPLDLQPVSDSLRLNYYNIKSLSVRSYSSVEGPEEKNIELQKKRAESILASLQSFQQLKIVNEIAASENWVEFLNDISGTKYATFKSLSKEEIKAELVKKNVSDELEPILSKHRKGVLFLELEKKSRYVDASEEEIKKHFQEAITKNNINTAWEIQQAIFQNIESKVYDPRLVKDLEIPEKAEYGSLLMNNLVFTTNQDEASEMSALTDFQRLNDLTPNNPFIKYNICVVELKLFSQNELIVERRKMLQDIKALEKLSIDKRLIRRLTINYHIILAEYLQREKQYAEKDKSLGYVNMNYKSTNYKDEDLLRLAQYFVAFRKTEWSLKIIEGRANKIDVSEDLLYYYLNITISDSKYTSKESYRSILLNAYNLNPERFCSMFGTAYKGGISFQLLDDKYLKKNYCESCKNGSAVMKKL